MKTKFILLWLDDIRDPAHSSRFIDQKMRDLDVEIVWVKNYQEFKSWIEANKLPEFISFDHDLADIHYDEVEDWEDYYKLEDREMTGYDAALFLVEYCDKNYLRLPNYWVHSQNPIGKLNINHYLENAQKHLDL